MTIEIEEVAGDEMKNKISVDVAAGNEPDVWQFCPAPPVRILPRLAYSPMWRNISLKARLSLRITSAKVL